jgi:hypothetical protein
MKRLLTVVCLAAGITTANDARSQTTRKNTTPAAKALAIKDVAVVGCLERGSHPGSFGLSIVGMGTQPSGQVADPRAMEMLPPGTHAELVGMEKGPLESYLGQQVEVAGMILPDRARGKRSADARISVLYIREIAKTCAVTVPIPAPVPAPAPASGAPTAPAPASQTGTSAGLRQTGISGNASLTWTSPVISYSRPDGQPITFTMPASGLMPTASPRPTATAAPTAATAPSAAAAPVTTAAAPAMTPAAPSTSAAADFTTQAAPVTTAAMPIATGNVPAPGSAPVATTVPGPVQTGDPSFAQQGATNTTGTTSELTQTGISGDALLSGLVNVNVQQVLASVQLTANLNVQDVIVNVSDVLNDNQIQALVQALNTNPQAAMNASDLTSALQQAGAINPTEWVVGVTGSEIYSNRDLTNTLQSRGIIQPGEVIVGHTPARVFVADGK